MDSNTQANGDAIQAEDFTVSATDSQGLSRKLWTLLKDSGNAIIADVRSICNAFIFAVAVGGMVSTFMLMGTREKLTNQLIEVTAQRDAAVIRAVRAETQLSKALVPEATVGEAWHNHVVTPVTTAVSKAYGYTAEKASDAYSAVVGWLK